MMIRSLSAEIPSSLNWTGVYDLPNGVLWLYCRCPQERPRGKSITNVLRNQYMLVICYESDGSVTVETLYRLLAVFSFSKLLACTILRGICHRE